LCYRQQPQNQATVRRHYLKWREQQKLPLRCDNEACTFHSQPLEWNGKRLPLILDHKNGNRLDNSPGNLRLLCPNCDSQLPTRGGANRGRVEVATENSYILLSKGGRKDYHIIPRDPLPPYTDQVTVVVMPTTEK
jgi:hypothetical protein